MLSQLASEEGRLYICACFGEEIHMPSNITERLQKIRDQISQTAQEVGRDPSTISLVAVSKYQPAGAVAEAIEAGQRVFGESRLQGAAEKIETIRLRFSDLSDDIHWSFIGALQSNKVKPILECFHSIQSIDRVKLLNRVDRIAGELNVSKSILLQVNVSGAEMQGGIPISQLPSLAEAAAKCDHIRVDGLMAIGANSDNEDEIRSSFRDVRKAADALTKMNLPNISMNILSMGMTGDYKIAIEEGSTLVRIGTAIFGPRPS
ncbi:hypothetical protein BMS3Bbin04_00827 [bacterium BMS3Bbin04]|nr:hypothetical protein BMS3Bbin04_00827 [bacterium BMS3Bbin04]